MTGVRSMTGFAAAEGNLPDGTTFTVSLKSVNHRFLDLHFRLPNGCDSLEMELRRLLKEALARGHVELTLELGRVEGAGQRINEEALGEIVVHLRQVAGRLGVTGEPDLAALLRLPGVLLSEGRGARPAEAAMTPAVLQTTAAALEQFQAVREQEGEALAAELRAGMARLRAASDAVSALRTGVRQAQFERMRARLNELLGAASVSEERLLTEAGLLAEKSDVEEEAVRLRTHIEHFLAMLDSGGPVGKRLDFLLQELNREANTTLAKTGSAAGPEGMRITEFGLEMKSEIERAKEQVQNLE